jgi:hypothetical protein
MYQEQLERVKRAFIKIDNHLGDYGEQKEYEDNLWCFFQAAWHLKDWIINDETVVKDNIEEIVKDYISLMVCADMANRTKHYTLKKLNRRNAKCSGNDVTIRVTTAEIGNADLANGRVPTAEGGESKYTYYITDNTGTKYIAVELAKQIIQDWEEIVVKHVRVQ